MAVTAANLLMGPGVLYIADFGTAEPADADIADPPGAGWNDVGGTLGGLTVAVEQAYTELTVDQIVDLVGNRLTKRVMSLNTQLAEATLDSLARALNNPLPTPGVGFTAFEPPNDNSATQPLYRAVLFDGFAPGTNNNLRRRIIGRKVLSTENLETAYSKDGQTVFQVGFKCHYVSDAIRPFKVTDEAAA
jgi:hypothetical protein